jgi:hypothetical protein
MKKLTVKTTKSFEVVYGVSTQYKLLIEDASNKMQNKKKQK